MLVDENVFLFSYSATTMQKYHNKENNFNYFLKLVKKALFYQNLLVLDENLNSNDESIMKKIYLKLHVWLSTIFVNASIESITLPEQRQILEEFLFELKQVGNFLIAFIIMIFFWYIGFIYTVTFIPLTHSNYFFLNTISDK